jgi:hypothetical protein
MRYFGWLAGGFALFWFSKVFAAMGDAAPFAAAGGVSGERLAWHGLALVILLGGLACFIRTGILAYRSITGRGAIPAERKPLIPGPEAPEAFDPDAALARYLAAKGTESEVVITRPRPHPGGFGRRVV